LIEKLDQKTIEGIVFKSISNASALHNITKVLEVLSSKRIIPLYYTYSAEGIARGDPEIIIGVLKSIRHAYKNSANTTFRKTRRSFDSEIYSNV